MTTVRNRSRAMLQSLWNVIKRIFGLDIAWEVMTLSRVGIDPATARALTRVLQPAHTIRLRPEPEAEPAADRPGLLWHGITHTGMVRPHNEDRLAHLSIGQDALFVVADGMGGHDAGEVASSIAVDAAVSCLRKGAGKNDRLPDIERAFRQANEAVKREAAERGSNMGTTLAVALVADGTAFIGSVGDSRVYWIANGAITQLTKDHSLVAKLVEAGKLTREEARTDPRSNLLYRTIGNEDRVGVDTFRVPLGGRGTLLLCTDGLWGEVPDEEILAICSAEEQTEIICARLVQRANANGGKDNITAIVVKVE